MKYVVVYSTGEYDSFYEHNICIESESKDHFQVAFLDAFEEWVKLKKRYNKLQKDLSDARASSDPRKMTPAWEAWKAYCSSPEYQLNYFFVVDGYKMPSPENDLHQNKESEWSLMALPEIYTLDEWFDLHRPEKVAK